MDEGVVCHRRFALIMGRLRRRTPELRGQGAQRFRAETRHWAAFTPTLMTNQAGPAGAGLVASLARAAATASAARLKELRLDPEFQKPCSNGGP